MHADALHAPAPRCSPCMYCCPPVAGEIYLPPFRRTRINAQSSAFAIKHVQYHKRTHARLAVVVTRGDQQLCTRMHDSVAKHATSAYTNIRAHVTLICSDRDSDHDTHWCPASTQAADSAMHRDTRHTCAYARPCTV
jgi:hypothetical protein